ncbi:hypothetical protein EA462_09930 [Natrarchaeobius halalkaliphilus]|uniref:Uncharacterized protein n=1 Tax=Natrarchaeobius halalkaliphilus TaxID=1679091 RepID=A0A3N6LPZ6_9EURY|nr:hypothetical protein [Natrarchaeobius halalkaliphilus]RQG90287.1 hypothetical protein EA462_09930 [Natrarchaeobius halalkaliphilus]
MVAPTRDRGQVILIGAIVIAFVILGTVVAFNGLVQTEEASSSATSQSVTHATVAESELQQGLQNLAAHDVQRAGGWEAIIDDERVSTALRDDSEWEDAGRSLGELHGNLTRSERVAVTDIRVHHAGGDERLEAIYGERNPPGHEDILERSATDGSRVLSLNLTGWTPNMDGELVIRETNGQTTHVEIESGSDPTPVTINSTSDRFAGERSCEADAVDLVTGTIENAAGSCDEMAIVDSSREYEYIESREGNGQFTYDLVAIGDVVGEDDGVSASVTVTYTYHSNDLRAERTTTVDLYGDLE